MNTDTYLIYIQRSLVNFLESTNIYMGRNPLRRKDLINKMKNTDN